MNYSMFERLIQVWFVALGFKLLASETTSPSAPSPRTGEGEHELFTICEVISAISHERSAMS